MSFFRERHKFSQDCIYDPYADLESEIVGEVQRIFRAEEIDKDLPDIEAWLQNNEDSRKHLLKLIEVFEAFDIEEVICFLIVARTNFPNAWHKVNAKIDREQRELLESYENIRRGEQKI